MQRFIFIIATSFIIIGIISCAKQNEFLDQRYSMSDVVPTTIDELQGLLDNDAIMNNNAPALALAGTDNFNVSDIDILTLDVWERNAYMWKKDIFEGSSLSEWGPLYTIVRNANIVLEGLEKLGLPTSNIGGYNRVKGSALFYRALAFYHLAQTFAQPYSTDASNKLGIPLRTSSDVNIKLERATLQQTYDKILSDLNLAETLLPATTDYITRPSKATVYALQAKVFLQMNDFVKAGESASKCLNIKNTLLDFNSISDGSFPFRNYSRSNPEYLFYMLNVSFSVFNSFSRGLVDSNFYKTYEAADIRKKLFFRVTVGTPNIIHFKGSYSVGIQFGGLAVNEVYLILAESLVRQNKLTEGLAALNTL
ncbi:MAG: RagB/SusD family nutrient uptake outer membrane protein, partial [Sediminibacterium sp.]